MLQVDAEEFFKFQKGQLNNAELLIGEHVWNHMEKAQKVLYEGGTILLVSNNTVYATMTRDAINGYRITKLRNPICLTSEK